MYICICHGITDTSIESAIEEGTVTMKGLSKKLRVGSQCGQCCACTKKILTKKLLQISERQSTAA